MEDKSHKELKKSLIIETDFDYSTRIIAVAVAVTEPSLNGQLLIPAISGTPLCEEVHDLVRDQYYVSGVSWYDLGEIHIAFRFLMEGVFGWEVDVPIPGPMIESYLTEHQKEELERWAARFDEHYSVIYLQLRSVF